MDITDGESRYSTISLKMQQKLIFFAVKEGQISKDGQWMWVNSEWKLIADLDRNDYKKDSNAGYWYGKNDQNIFI